jgi:deoxyribonuclease V
MDPSKYESLSPIQAVKYQQELRQSINLEPFNGPVNTIAGADISYNKYSSLIYAGIVVMSYPDLKVLHRAGTVAQTEFPYISGLLAFREIPALLEVWDTLQLKPDIMLLDGQGIAHPRRLGIATHFGLLTDVPSVGVAKSRLFGRFDEPSTEAGAASPLLDRAEQLGIAYRSKKNCNPIFISPGHRMNIAQSAEIVKNCVGKYRIPEPTRLAHEWVNELRMKVGAAPSQVSLFD